MSQGFATQGVLISLLLPAVQAAREAARRTSSSNNLKMMGLAMHNYHAAYRHFPADIKSDDGTPLLSWRVAILPFLDQVALYEQFHLDEPWDSPHNIQLVEQMPAAYSHPSLVTPRGTTVYQRPVSEEYLMRPSEAVAMRDITDGTSNTIMALATVADHAAEWTKPADVVIDKADPMSSVVDGTRRGFNVLFGDGSVIFFGNDVEPQNFLGLLTRAGGEAVER